MDGRLSKALFKKFKAEPRPRLVRPHFSRVAGLRYDHTGHLRDLDVLEFTLVATRLNIMLVEDLSIHGIPPEFLERLRKEVTKYHGCTANDGPKCLPWGEFAQHLQIQDRRLASRYLDGKWTVPF